MRRCGVGGGAERVGAGAEAHDVHAAAVAMTPARPVKVTDAPRQLDELFTGGRLADSRAASPALR